MTTPNASWGDPSPAGLFAIGIGNVAVWAYFTGRVEPADLPMLVVWLFAAAIVLVVTGLISLRRGDEVGGNLNLTFGVMFFGAPALTNVVLIWGGQPMAEMGDGSGLALNGWVFLLMAAILVSFVPIVARQTALLAVAVSVFSVAITLLALFTLQPAAAQQAGVWPAVGQLFGWLVAGAGLMMVYLGIAMSLLNGLGRVVLPIPGPIGGDGATPDM